MTQSRFYIHFISAKEAQNGLDILCNAASENSGFLSYNNFRRIVYGEAASCDPTYGWSLEVLQKSKLEPHCHMYVLNMSSPDKF